ncbi:endolytic transglycosylase MltG [Candidatus Kaiserbacteria bacterium]|nr:endolytic transglycosylase MltG [Candidatus Kaiserbacteria bacterium]
MKKFAPKIEDVLVRLLDAGQSTLKDMSVRWREHTNRRTLIALILSGVLAITLYVFVIQPPDNFPVGELVSVPEGTSLSETAKVLQDDGVVRSAIAFRVLVTLLGAERTVHAGDYLFDKPLDVFAIARAIAVGQYGLEPLRIRVPEGASVKEIGNIFEIRLQRFNAANFLAQAEPLEGYLFPDTYFFLPNTTEDTVLQAMRQNFDTHVATLQPAVARSARSFSDIITMASILEREAYNTADRKLIAGVLWNRIERGMPLQVDAVFAYSIGKGTFQLTVKDLTTPSPYNTYMNKGLPPTPIGNPSLDSIEAALYPAKTDYLYFLADHKGVTHYCKTYACQLANKAKYF